MKANEGCAICGHEDDCHVVIEEHYSETAGVRTIIEDTPFDWCDACDTERGGGLVSDEDEQFFRHAFVAK